MYCPASSITTYHWTTPMLPINSSRSLPDPLSKPRTDSYSFSTVESLLRQAISSVVVCLKSVFVCLYKHGLEHRDMSDCDVMELCFGMVSAGYFDRCIAKA